MNFKLRYQVLGFAPPDAFSVTSNLLGRASKNYLNIFMMNETESVLADFGLAIFQRGL